MGEGWEAGGQPLWADGGQAWPVHGPSIRVVHGPSEASQPVAACGHRPHIHGLARERSDRAGRSPESKPEGRCNRLRRSAKKLLASGVPPKDVAKNLGVSIPTLYRWVLASAQA